MTGVRARPPGPKAWYAMAGLLTLVLSAPAQAASAASAGPGPRASPPAWARQATPNPLVPTASLASVSCPTAGTCTAVGQYFDRAGYWAALAEARTGATWKVEPTPSLPAGATGVTLSGVSCTAADACTAVGSYVNSAEATVTLAEAWNGTTWTIQATPNPAGSTDSVLLGVSCAAADACMAVGYYINSGTDTVTLAEAWNGTAWTVQATPNPAGSPDNELLGVSCASPRTCEAVGYFISDTAAGTVAESWNGASWAIQATPHPRDDIDASLASVSCTSAVACTAVGGYATPAQAGKTLAEAWNGTTWTIQATPNVPGSHNNYLGAVSCAAAGACTAAGAHQAIGQPELTLAESWNGTSWTIQATPSPPGATVSNLSGISCPAGTACTAVGTHLTSAATSLTLAETWDGTSWAIQSPPTPVGATFAQLSAVSCVDATACTAVGHDRNILGGSGREKTLAESWNGTSWRIQATPTVANGSVLSAVSCTAPGACMAVGYYLNSFLRPVSLAEEWNGTTWTRVPTPNPPGADITLTGVSCAAASSCTAVGWYDSSSGALVTLAESWNGTSWRVQATPNPGATFSELNAVSCTAADACTAVGLDTSGTLVESWNGTSWHAQASPNPAGATRILLSGVSCTAADACTAVGSYDVSGSAMPLAERENGTRWVIEATPIARDELPSGLSAVSCTAATACTAVGYHYNSSNEQVPFADAWNGTTWTVQPAPEPAGSIGGVLSGVSCPAGVGCTAAGYSVNRSPDYRTLADASHGAPTTGPRARGAPVTPGSRQGN